MRGPLLVAWAAGLCSQGIAAPAVLGPAKTKVEINDQKIIVIFFTNLSFNFFSVHLYDIRARVGVLNVNKNQWGGFASGPKFSQV